MMRREVFEKVGMYSEEYFMYSEDFDLCWTILRAGYSNYYVGAGHIIHYGGVSSPRAVADGHKLRADLRWSPNFRGPFYAFLSHRDGAERGGSPGGRGALFRNRAAKSGAPKDAARIHGAEIPHHAENLAALPRAAIPGAAEMRGSTRPLQCRAKNEKIAQ